MRFFGKRQPSAHSALNVIITSDRVELVVSLTAGGRSRIIFETGAPIELSVSSIPNEANVANEASEAISRPLLLRLSDALKKACNELTKEGLAHIVSRTIAKGRFDSVEVFYGAPWYVSRGRHVTIERSGTAPLTENELEELITQNIEGVLPSEMKSAVILEEYSQGFTVNGYRVENPIGKEGREVGMRLFVSAIDEGTRVAVEDIVFRSFHAHEISHHSTLLRLVRSLRRANVAENAYLLADVSGYMTEVSKIDRGMVLGTASFPEGHETLLRGAAGALKRRPEEVKALAARPKDFGLAPEFRAAHDDALGDWSRRFVEALEALGMGGMSGNTILIAETSSQDSFKNEITRMTGGQVTLLLKDAYISLYDLSARPNAHILSALLALF
jgi:hypothetical protein